MPTNAINDTGVKYLYDKLHGEIEPIAEAVSDSEVTIEGNPLNFNTLSSQKSKSTILSLEPIQDLHGYDKPWVGGAGKNKINTLDREITNTDSLTTIRTENCTVVKNGDIFNCTCSSSGGYAKLRILLDTSKLENGATYTFSAKFDNPNSNYVGVGYVPNAQGSWIATASSAGGYKSISFVFDSSWTTILFGLLLNNSGTPNTNIVYVSEIQLEKASTKSDYEPYENICPISGRTEIGILGCGKNLLDVNEYSGSEIYLSSRIFKVTGNYVHRNIIFSGSGVYNFKLFGIKDGVETAIDEAGYAVSLNDIKNYVGNYDYVRTSGYSNNSSNRLSNIMLAFSDDNTDMAYEPYTKSNDLTISLGQTVYGGTLDVENGVLVVEKVKETLNWNTYKRTDTSAGIIRRVFQLSADAMTNNAITDVTEYQGGWSDFSKAHFYIDYYSQSYYAVILFLPENISSDTQINICYELATPITINLTPHTINLLKGVNNISTDGDKITLTYRDGSVATLGDLTSAVDNLDSKIDESKILTDTVTGDKYILVVTNGVLSVEQVSN